MIYHRLAVIGHTLFPAWINRAIVNIFPRGTTIHSIKEIANTLSVRSREIYNTKRQALEKGEAEIPKQVTKGKDVMSLFSASHHQPYNVRRQLAYMAVRANAAADPKDRLSVNEVAEQMSLVDTDGDVYLHLIVVSGYSFSQPRIRRRTCCPASSNSLQPTRMFRIGSVKSY